MIEFILQFHYLFSNVIRHIIFFHPPESVSLVSKKNEPVSVALTFHRMFSNIGKVNWLIFDNSAHGWTTTTYYSTTWITLLKIEYLWRSPIRYVEWMVISVHTFSGLSHFHKIQQDHGDSMVPIQCNELLTFFPVDSMVFIALHQNVGKITFNRFWIASSRAHIRKTSDSEYFFIWNDWVQYVCKIMHLIFQSWQSFFCLMIIEFGQKSMMFCMKSEKKKRKKLKLLFRNVQFHFANNNNFKFIQIEIKARTTFAYYGDLSSTRVVSGVIK